ncbi:MAG: HAMP domain-containing histidine kinase [Candidatus Eremiobacteraeota bacterium]|nr:HAMP domain-containing histidine kinase [Candidatus Eremiobacteraeota bacterium]
MILRTAALYLGIFICVLLALDAAAYAFIAREYASSVAPALATPEVARALATAMRRVLITLSAIDLPLIAIVALASYALARVTIAPLQAARERERIFAADAAHELRSPLAAIAAIAQAARTGATQEARTAFDAIASSALEASAVVSDLLTLARDPGRRALQCEPVDLGAVVASTSRETEPVARARGIRVQSAPASAIVDGDERRLRELARNLLDNAVRHARGNVSIASRRNGSLCEIVVEDDGDGVPPQERQRVFQRFYRRANDGTGSGLGLAIVRWIANAHEGDVTVEAASWGGARFIVAIPAHKENLRSGA